MEPNFAYYKQLIGNMIYNKVEAQLTISWHIPRNSNQSNIKFRQT